jgi:hypothetical protein
MKAARTLFFVLFNVAVTAPLAAWPVINNPHAPGSVLVFPKWRSGTLTLVDQGVVPVTEFEISVRCPIALLDCQSVLPDYPNVHLSAHWVCSGDQGDATPGICHETDFTLTTTVNGTLHLTSEPLADPITGLPVTSVNQANGAFTPMPPPPCANFTGHGNEVYLILWVVDLAGNPIKFDGLIGDALVRGGPREESEEVTLEEYNAYPIQADPDLATGASTDLDAGGNHTGTLAFDGEANGHYLQVTGVVIGTARYEGSTYLNPAAKTAARETGRLFTALTLLSLDVLSNRSNDVTYLDLDFFSEGETLHSTSTTFVCYTTQTLSGFGGGKAIDTYLTNANMGRKGLMVSGPAQRQDGTPVSVLGLLETTEFHDFDDFDLGYAYALFDDNNPVTTTFYPF